MTPSSAHLQLAPPVEELRVLKARGRRVGRKNAFARLYNVPFAGFNQPINGHLPSFPGGLLLSARAGPARRLVITICDIKRPRRAAPVSAPRI